MYVSWLPFLCVTYFWRIFSISQSSDSMVIPVPLLVFSPGLMMYMFFYGVFFFFSGSDNRSQLLISFNYRILHDSCFLKKFLKLRYSLSSRPSCMWKVIGMQSNGFSFIFWQQFFILQNRAFLLQRWMFLSRWLWLLTV